jgi:uncharacterized iron-regulated membrane protein
MFRHNSAGHQREVDMPIGSLLVFVAVAAMFVAFAGVLMWSDHRSRSARPSLATASTKRRSF